jgi:hypothetical protein
VWYWISTIKRAVPSLRSPTRQARPADQLARCHPVAQEALRRRRRRDALHEPVAHLRRLRSSIIIGEHARPGRLPHEARHELNAARFTHRPLGQLFDARPAEERDGAHPVVGVGAARGPAVTTGDQRAREREARTDQMDRGRTGRRGRPPPPSRRTPVAQSHRAAAPQHP